MPRVHTLGADYTADRSRKVNQRVMVRKENVQDPASVRGQKAKAMQRMKMTNPTQLSGEKENSKEKAKGQERNERSGFFQTNACLERKRKR